MKLCPAHTREADEWVQCVQELANHPSMRPLDNPPHTDRTKGRNATTVVKQQVGSIHEHCQQGKGCGR